MDRPSTSWSLSEFSFMCSFSIPGFRSLFSSFSFFQKQYISFSFS